MRKYRATDTACFRGFPAHSIARVFAFPLCSVVLARTSPNLIAVACGTESDVFILVLSHLHLTIDERSSDPRTAGALGGNAR